MVDQTPKFRAYDPDPDEYSDDPINSRPAPYKFGRSARTNSALEHSVPLFLSDPDGEPDPQEFIAPLRRGGLASFSSRILMAVLAASAAAMLFAWFSSDAMRGVVANAEASIAALMPAPSAAAQPDSASLTPGDLQLKDPASANTQISQQVPQQAAQDTTQAAAAPAVPQMEPSAPAPAPAPVMVASASPTHEQISDAYQNALQGQVPQVQAATAPVVMPPAAQPVRKIDRDELASLIESAKQLLRLGNIPAARLMLKRAAAARDPTAALMLARTYDPKVLGPENVPSFKPQPAEARAWYKKAAEYGSAEAQRVLAALPN